MSAGALLAELKRLGIEIEADDDRLRYAGPEEALAPGLIERLKLHKVDLLALLHRGEKDSPEGYLASPIDVDALRWPAECLKAEHRFGCHAARLYPLLNEKVNTSRGPGKLWQVFGGQAGVVLDGNPKQVEFVRPEEVRPIKQGTEPK
jgi:hypothetical protein